MWTKISLGLFLLCIVSCFSCPPVCRSARVCGTLSDGCRMCLCPRIYLFDFWFTCLWCLSTHTRRLEPWQIRMQSLQSGPAVRHKDDTFGHECHKWAQRLTKICKFTIWTMRRQRVVMPVRSSTGIIEYLLTVIVCDATILIYIFRPTLCMFH